MIRQVYFGKTASDGAKMEPVHKNSVPDGKQSFFRDVVDAAIHLKTGTGLSIRANLDVRPFSQHKAKAIRLGTRSFPTFVIRTNQQRSLNSNPGRGDWILPSGITKYGERRS
jgi:hypothetical protein